MSPPIRLAELIGGLSLAADVANVFSPEKAVRTALLAVNLAKRHGLEPAACRDVYYAALLRFLGCTAFAHEEAHRYGAGDDVAVRTTMALADPADPVATLARIARGIAPRARGLERAAAVSRLLGDGRAVKEHARAQCEASIRLATLIGFGGEVTRALAQICERHDGRGHPHGLRGDALTPVVRMVHLADVVEVAHAEAGVSAAVRLAERRAGGHFDPDVADTFRRCARELLAPLEGPSAWEAFVQAEPEPRAIADAARVDDVALAFAYYADLKSVYTLGHSTGVADLAARTADVLGFDPELRVTVRRAALLHDIGRVSVANGTWDKPGSLTAAEWERVRLHAYHTERILWQATPLRPLAHVAAAAHERLDGAGYPRAVPRALIDSVGRVLAAADAYHAMLESRPHRPALDANAARRALEQEVAGGRLDAAAVSAVLEATGERPRRPPRPAGLSDREVEVLVLVARGQSNKEIAAALRISSRTVQHHVAHVYGKISVSSRAAAALFAVENGLL